MIGTRYVTGSELKLQTESCPLLVMFTGGIAFGFLALYLAMSGTTNWWLFGLYLISLPVGLVLYRVMKKQYPEGIRSELLS